MGFAVYHCEKKKTTGGGLGNHIDRVKGKEHTYPHADKSRLDLNVHFTPTSYCKMPFAQAIEQRISDGFKGKTIRKDAVKFVTHVLTGSHEDMISIFSDEENKKAWIAKNFQFLVDEYGKENIVRFTLHLDEKTPHLHAVTVPITNEGKLSAKEIIGNRKDMQNRQDRYGEAMKIFGLERGLKNTGIRHETTDDYRKRVNEINSKEPIETKIKVIHGVFGGIHKQTIQNAEELLKTAKNRIQELESELATARYRTKTSSENASYYKEREQRVKNSLRQEKQKLEQLKTEAHKTIMSNSAVINYRESFEKKQAEEKTSKKGRGYTR